MVMDRQGVSVLPPSIWLTHTLLLIDAYCFISFPHLSIHSLFSLFFLHVFVRPHLV